MAFRDNPIVDHNSKASEQSVLAVKGLLCQDNGFISRDETPDFGADLNVELISRGASGRRFAVQIKSSASLSYLQDGKTISYPFETSRLGYLARSTPGYGLVILFDSNTKTPFYGFVEDLIERLELEGSDNWKDQSTVNIHVPTQNRLTHISVKHIHLRLSRRFDNLDHLLITHGSEYRIFGNKNDRLEFSNPIEIRESLLKFGRHLINSFDFKTLFELISRLSIREINSSPELLLLAAITFTEIGKPIDASYYINQVLLKPTENRELDSNIIKFCKLKVDFQLGKKKGAEYLADLISLNDESESVGNTLMIQLNILYFRLSDLFKGREEIPNRFEAELIHYFDQISNSDIEPRLKQIIRLYHCQNINACLMNHLAKDTATLKIREATGQTMPPRERAKLGQRVFQLIELLVKYHTEAFEFADKNQDQLVKAHTLKTTSEHFFSLMLHFFILEKSTGVFERKIFESNLTNALLAYQLFAELELHHEAYLTLTTAYEIMQLFQLQEGELLGGISADDLLNQINELAVNIGHVPFKCIVLEAHAKKAEPDGWLAIPDDEEHAYASTIARGMQLPDDRVTNIALEIKGFKLFERRCKNPDIAMFIEKAHLNSRETMYASSPRFILKNKRTGMESQFHSDINSLLDQYQYWLDVRN